MAQTSSENFSLDSFFLPQIFSSDTAPELFEETSFKEIGNADDFRRLGSGSCHHLSTDMFWMVGDVPRLSIVEEA
jgi:hypothetical protein